jgi:hypothetical protein
MPLVRVNISGVAASVLRTLPKRSDRAAVLKQLGAAAMQFWKRQAQQNLRTSSRDYVQSLQHEVNDERVRITLRGMIPNMIENGWSGGDMRDWLLKGPNAKLGPNGMYNTVPFRHGTPGTTGRNVGPQMPRAIHNVAKRLSATLSRPGIAHGYSGGRHVVYGQRLHPGVLRMGKQAKDILTTLHRPWHSTGIYRGMIREEKHYSSPRKTQAQYMTFRRISRKVAIDPRTGAPSKDHWIHPGIKPRRFALATQKHIEGLAQSIVLGVVGK